MSETTGIGWTDHTFNPWWGCTEVSPGCAHCYARVWAARMGHAVWGKHAPRKAASDGYWTKPLAWNRAAAKVGERRRVFCASMGDVFEDHPLCNAERPKLWPLIRATPHLDWLLLTKRAHRIAECLPDDWGNGYPNVWLGVSVENQSMLPRIERLAAIPAVVRFVSAEPLLGPLEIPPDLLLALDWIIVGGESGPDGVRREMQIEWMARVVEGAVDAAVAVYVKQDSARRDSQQGRIPDWLWAFKQWPPRSESDFDLLVALKASLAAHRPTAGEVTP